MKSLPEGHRAKNGPVEELVPGIEAAARGGEALTGAGVNEFGFFPDPTTHWPAA